MGLRKGLSLGRRSTHYESPRPRVGVHLPAPGRGGLELDSRSQFAKGSGAAKAPGGASWPGGASLALGGPSLQLCQLGCSVSFIQTRPPRLGPGSPLRSRCGLLSVRSGPRGSSGLLSRGPTLLSPEQPSLKPLRDTKLLHAATRWRG